LKEKLQQLQHIKEEASQKSKGKQRPKKREETFQRPFFRPPALRDSPSIAVLDPTKSDGSVQNPALLAASMRRKAEESMRAQ
jgi:hypothetical protein